MGTKKEVTYFLKRGEKVVGPHPLSTIKQGVREKQLGASDLFSRSQSGPWLPLADLFRPSPVAAPARKVENEVEDEDEDDDWLKDAVAAQKANPVAKGRPSTTAPAKQKRRERSGVRDALASLSSFVLPTPSSTREVSWRNSYGGKGRVSYLIGTVTYPIICILFIVFLTRILPQNLALGVLIVSPLMMIGAWVKLTLDRLANIGYPKWFTLLYFAPFVNAWFFIVLSAAPEGYADHKTFDLPGKILIGVIVLLSVLPFFVGIIAGISSGGSGTL
jgi:uncharacterized membrane protein YhaH (DUF805 family)